MRPVDDDDRLREAAYAYVQATAARSGGLVRTSELTEFEFEGQRISLLQHMRGIRVVSGMEAALTIRTTYVADPRDAPYEDTRGPDGYLRYQWQGTDPDAYDNVALRRAREAGKPLLWFRGVDPGVFMWFRVWLVAEEPDQHQFVVALDSTLRDQWDVFHPADEALRREYAVATVRRRLHQPLFRHRVLRAYGSLCSLCRLRHPELLDAAHIKEDADGGEPVVTNGVAMCAIHHRAFDAQVLGIRPDYVIQVRRDVLEEHDGPTLRHALQGLHDAGMRLPRQRAAYPDRGLLGERYERFQAAG